MTVRTLALSASFALVALVPFVGGCSGSESATAPASDAGADAEPQGPATNLAFFEAAADPICERLFHCCTTESERTGPLIFYGVEETPKDLETCKTSLKAALANFAGFVELSFATGRLEFVPSEAGKCLAEIEASASTCDGFIVGGIPAQALSCPKAYEAKVEVGGECITSSECVDSVCRPVDAARTKGQCQPLGKEGDFCLGAESCEPGLVCSEVVEEACVGSSKSSVCRKPVARGSFCCSTNDCAEGLDCYSNDDGKPLCRNMLPTTPVPDEGVCDGK